jgi:hypothetical protein
LPPFFTRLALPPRFVFGSVRDGVRFFYTIFVLSK